MERGGRADRPFFELSGPSGAPVVLWNEECRAGLADRVPRESVDVVVTSPPYNLGVPYRHYDDRRARPDYLAFIGELGSRVRAALSPSGSFFLNVGGPPRDPWLPWDVAAAIRPHLVLQNVIHWVKSIAIDREAAGERLALAAGLAIGHYKPVRSDRYLHSAHEYVFQFTHTGAVPLDRLAIGVPYQDKSNIDRWKSAGTDLRCRGNTWFLPYPTIQRRSRDRPHPAAFPVELPDRCLRLHGRERIRLAVDPFVGIGASAIAAARLGIPFVGFDLDAEYLTTARRRLEAEFPRAAPTAVVASGTRGAGRGLSRHRTIK